MRSLYDLQSLAYIVAYVALTVWQWIYGFHFVAYLLLLFFSIGLQVVHHNHTHLGIWFHKGLNYFTSLVISVITAVPNAMMWGGHLKNHHVHQHGPEDHTRTYRYGGDHNHFIGYFLHPFQAFFTLIPVFWNDFLTGWPRRERFARAILTQVVLIFLLWAVLLVLDWRKFLWLVLVPQLWGLHWLLASNYFQHAHCDDASKSNYARNFTGYIVNTLWFNIGFHTAHHDHPRVHWSQLRQTHETIKASIDPRLNHRSFSGYVLRHFFLSLFVPSLRSESLREGD